MTSAFQSGAFQVGAFQTGRVPRGWDDAARRTPIIIVEYEDEPEQPKPVRKPKRRKRPVEYVPEPDFVPIEFEPFVQPDLPPLPVQAIDYSQLAIARYLEQQAEAQRIAAQQDEEAAELLLLTVN